MAVPRSMSGGAVPTTLAAPIGSGDLLLDVATLEGTWPDTSKGPFMIVVDPNEDNEEQILISSNTTDQFTVPTGGRGRGNTPGASHSAGAVIIHGPDPESMMDVSQHVIDTTRDDHTQYVKKVLYSTTGDILIATSADTPARLPIGANGQSLMVVGGVPAWANQLFHAGGNGGNIGLTTNSPVKVLDTASLAIGTWDITMGVLLQTPNNSGAGGRCEFWVADDTATATFLPSTVPAMAFENTSQGMYGVEVSISMRFVAVVTVAGTLQLIGFNTGGGSDAIALSNTLTEGKGPATYYSALKIA